MNEQLRNIQTGLQAGFDDFYDGNTRAACDQWLQVWAQLRDYARGAGITTLAALTKQCDGEPFVESWLDDMDVALVQASRESGRQAHPRSLTLRIQWAGEFADAFRDDEPRLLRQMRIAMAESYFLLAQVAKAEALFETVMSEDPQWWWGWCCWADCYRSAGQGKKVREKIEGLLLRAVAACAAEDHLEVLDRLIDFYDKTGQADKAEPYYEEREQLQNQLPDPQLGDEILIELGAAAKDCTVDAEVRLNAPCPCGSGRKYKDCCGK